MLIPARPKPEKRYDANLAKTMMPNKSVTREAAKILQIELVDHVIVGDVKSDPQGRGFFSFREAGHL